MQNLTSGFDPLVFNGILPTSTDTLLMTDMPVSSQYMYNPNFSEPKDTFTPSEPNKKGWKKWAFGALCVALGFAALKKMGFNPLKKVTNSSIFNSAKTFCTDKITRGIDIVKNIFAKKP